MNIISASSLFSANVICKEFARLLHQNNKAANSQSKSSIHFALSDCSPSDDPLRPSSTSRIDSFSDSSVQLREQQQITGTTNGSTNHDISLESDFSGSLHRTSPSYSVFSAESVANSDSSKTASQSSMTSSSKHHQPTNRNSTERMVDETVHDQTPQPNGSEGVETPEVPGASDDSNMKHDYGFDPEETNRPDESANDGNNERVTIPQQPEKVQYQELVKTKRGEGLGPAMVDSDEKADEGCGIDNLGKLYSFIDFSNQYK